MLLSIVHLSDIHFRVGGNSVLGKLEKLLEITTGETQGSDLILLIATGDIAYSGKSSEYKIAEDFFSKLKERAEENTKLKVHCYFIPGNHDCNFDLTNKVRDNLLSGNPSAFSNLTHEDRSILDSCMLHQDFFEFIKNNADGGVAFLDYDRLHYAYNLTKGDKRIRIHCFNTAWLSRKKDIQGKLFFPIDQIKADTEKYDLVISAFHHPYAWLESENAREFRRGIEALSDVVLTGHEHKAEVSEKFATTTGNRLRFVEGAVLQTDEKWQSGFNIVNIDIQNEKWKYSEYKWAQERQRYGRETTIDWEPFLRSSNLKQREFEPSREFASFLSDAGAGFTHPQAASVSLRDIFVFPDADLSPIDGDSERVLLGDLFMKYLLQHPRLFIAGSERSGKTALGKSIFTNVLEQGLVPIYVSGELINSWTQQDFMKIIRRQVERQYGESFQDKYDQQPVDSRLLILDDFHLIHLNRKGRNLLLGTITKLYPKTVLLGDELFLLQELPREDDESKSMLSFRNCHLRQFGHERRAKLIERWCSIGKEFTVEEEDIATEVAKKEKLIDTLLGKNLMPSIPIVILSMLQSLEARESLTTASGTYGYIYEVLITAQLSRMKKLTLDTKYTLLSCLAYRLFKSGKRSMNEAELDEVNTQYCDQYKMRIATNVLINELEQCSMLRKIDGLYRFHHKYSYYYFVAKYFQDNMQSDTQTETLREEITRVANQLYNEDSANILIFYIYLTKDLLIIKEMLQNTKSIFSEHEPCDMDSSIQFLLVATKKAPKLEYVETDLKESKGKYLRSLDSSETHAEEEEASVIQGEKELNDVLKLNVAFKTIQIMGQILRNFPGSLKGDVKLEIARETYLLGMRSLGMIMKALQTDTDSLKTFVRNYLKEKKGVTDPEDLNRRADDFVFWFGVVLGGSTIERISYSVGSDKLEETYSDLTKGDMPLALRLVDISIKLEHFTLPKADIIELNKELNKNIYAQTILKTRVLHHFYLYHVKRKVRHQLCGKLEIEVRPEAYERASKK